MKALQIFIGFLLFSIGTLSILVNLMGLEFDFLLWFDKLIPNGLLQFLAKIILIIIGVITIYFAHVDWKKEHLESAAD